MKRMIEGITEDYSVDRIDDRGMKGREKPKVSRVTNDTFSAFLWTGTESNRRHKDFQSFALPTELPVRGYFAGFECQNDPKL